MSENNASLDFLSDPPFQRRESIFERLGWVFMGLTLLAAALGLFGQGVLARAELSRNNFRLHYDRFVHYGDLIKLKIEVPPDAGDAGIVAVALPNSYLHSFRSDRIVPDPESSAHGDQTLFWFTNTYAGQSISILFYLEPEKLGRIQGKIIVNGEEEFVFDQFVYP